MQYELYSIKRIWRSKASWLLPSEEQKEGEDYFDIPLYRAVNPKRRALRETMKRLGLTGGRQKVKLRKMLNRNGGGERNDG